MIDVNQLRKGVTFEMDGQLYKVVEYGHHKPGRGKAVIRTRIRNMRTGVMIYKTFPSGDKVQDVRLDHHTVQYLYSDGDLYHFMDTETYEQSALSAEVLGEAVPYLVDDLTLELSTYEGEPIDIEMPITVEMEVAEAEPGFAGDTASGATKRVVTQTGLKVQAPLFIEVGDVIRVDTRTGTYITRV